MSLLYIWQYCRQLFDRDVYLASNLWIFFKKKIDVPYPYGFQLILNASEIHTHLTTMEQPVCHFFYDKNFRELNGRTMITRKISARKAKGK